MVSIFDECRGTLNVRHSVQQSRQHKGVQARAFTGHEFGCHKALSALPAHAAVDNPLAHGAPGVSCHEVLDRYWTIFCSGLNL